MANKVTRKAAQTLAGTGKKRKAVRKPATQAGVKFGKNKDIKSGMPSEEELKIDAELRTARVAKGSRKPSVTVGKKSDPAKFEPTELLSKSTKERLSKMVKIEKKIREGTATAAEKRFLDAARAQDTEALRRRNVRISQSMRGKKKAERTDYIDPETGEIFGTPTQKQLEVAARNARARGMTAKEREYRGFLEKEYGVEFYAGGLADKRYVNLVTSIDRRKKK